LAVAAADAGAGPAAGLLQARVLGERGQRDRAQALLAGLTAHAVTDEQRAVVAIERSRALLYWQGLGAQATATLDDAARRLTGHWREQVVAHRGLVALMRGQLSDALHAADVLDTATPGHGLATAAATAAVAAALAGHNAEAMTYCEQADRGREPGRARLALIVTLCESGRLAAASTAVATAYERALRMRSRTGQAWLSLLRGRIGLLTGQLGSAGHAFAEGQSVANQLGLLVLRRWCAAGAALAAAQRGDTDTAAARIAELDAVPPIDLHLQEPDELRARAWVAWLQGDPAAARQALAQAVAVATRCGAGALAAAAWHDLARLGAVDAAQPLVAFASGTDGELLAVRTAMVEALCCRDPDALASCADRFEALGAVLFAAESVAAAAAEHRRRGTGRTAERLAERASALAGRCDRANTPALRLTGPAAALTVREREIATLAAQGRSNRDIAETLTLSVRTVETHLQRAYAKLAVTSRAELTRALRTRDGEDT
jgi:DNA-binding NarL/FixJ family response regulator